ncbi:MAG: glycosyltransferase [Ardenticatenaceae bacterium]|nr:glycosyltransferase [Anaerolineales bacterium]MCB8920241.1 glycosyltransferase [Ardenticatenaceae bacterium]MCB8991974.1 glycosyltransferase [Ardenticatenaceae bacterium]MCB9004913.1 glycosyltransferase [Ardenticatenaceae bacterium]
MNIALVHDWLNQIGGAEDVLENLVSMYPERPLYTSLYWREGMPAHWQEWDIRTSFIDRLPFAHKKQQLYFPLYPLAFEQFDFREYDLVISNKSGFCHGIITGPETTHICYCLTPTRYVWRYHQYAEQENLGRLARTALPPFLTFLRQWDRLAADRVDYFIAISQEVRRRIAKVYGRESVIIYPPVDTGRFEPANRVDDYYVIVGRLVPYRRIDLLIEAFNKMGRRLLIAGDGRDRERLEALAGPTVEFLGYVPDADLPDLLARAQAFMFPGEEDFGIAPIQAMAAGRPVIAYAVGGALDTVIPDETGVLFTEQSAEAIIAAVKEFDTASVSPARIREHAMQFDTAVFRQKMTDFVDEKMAEKK